MLSMELISRLPLHAGLAANAQYTGAERGQQVTGSSAAGCLAGLVAIPVSELAVKEGALPKCRGSHRSLT